MKRVLLLVLILSATFVACRAKRTVVYALNIYIVSKEPGDGLQEANFPAFPKLGYIAGKPDLTISQLEGVSFGVGPRYPKPDGGLTKATQDKRSLELRLTANDAEQVNKLTAA